MMARRDPDVPDWRRPVPSPPVLGLGQLPGGHAVKGKDFRIYRHGCDSQLSPFSVIWLWEVA